MHRSSVWQFLLSNIFNNLKYQVSHFASGVSWLVYNFRFTFSYCLSTISWKTLRLDRCTLYEMERSTAGMVHIFILIKWLNKLLLIWYRIRSVTKEAVGHKRTGYYERGVLECISLQINYCPEYLSNSKSEHVNLLSLMLTVTPHLCI